MRVGRIKITGELLLRWLQFPNGRIRSIWLDSPEIIDITIEDKEMPEVQGGDAIPVVIPQYCSYEDCEGHRVAIRKSEFFYPDK